MRHRIRRESHQSVIPAPNEFSCGSIPDRGVHYGKKYMRKWLDSYDGKKFFVLKMDVHHFFESINRRILKRKLKEVIRDKRFYRLLCILIEHDKIAFVAKILTDAGVEIDAEQTKTLVGCIAFDDISGALEILQEIGITGAMFDELKEIIEEMRKGVPLGYFTSQWFGNFYLKALDHYIKEELRAEHYMRYMDDMVILGKSKKKLHKIHAAIGIVYVVGAVVVFLAMTAFYIWVDRASKKEQELYYDEYYYPDDEFAERMSVVVWFILSLGCAILWVGIPLLICGLIVYTELEEHCPELMGDMTDRNTEEFDKEENK